MNRRQQRDYAFRLFLQGVYQEEIAVRVGTTPQTISRWKKDGNWDRHRKSLLTTRQHELVNLYDQLSELNGTIKLRPKGERYPSKGEADTLVKLAAAIRQLETSTTAADAVDVFKEQNEFIRKVAPDKLKIMIELQDAFVKSLL